MRTLIGLLLILLTSAACSQKSSSVIGYVESFYSSGHIDSTYSPELFSEEEYENGKRVYKKQYDLWNQNCYDIEKTLNDSVNYRIEYCPGDSTYTEHKTEKSKNRRFSVQNGDTISISDLTYSDNKIIKIKCRKGCDTNAEVSYSGDTIFYKDVGFYTLFSMEIFDDKKRCVFYALPSHDKNDYPFFKHTFDDKNHTKTTISGYKDKVYETVTVNYDKNWVPKTAEVVIYNDGVIYLKYKIRYEYISKTP